MEKVITNELTKVLVLLAAAVAGLAAVTSSLIGKLTGSFKPYRKATILYLIVGVLFFSLIALTAWHPIALLPFNSLLLFQAYFLLLGIVHFWGMNEYMEWAGSAKAFVPELLFTLAVALAGCTCFLLVYYLLDRNGLQYVMAGSILFFIVPFLVVQTFKRAASIPPKILKEWYYPLGQEIDEPEDAKMRNLKVISFEFQKQTNDPHYTNFRAKAPADMDFGMLFYYFINDYNERHSNSRIEIADLRGAPHGWVFYKKARWYTVMTSYIDAEKTIHNNRIKENDVIICARYVN